MAFVNAEISLDMWSSFNFSSLNNFDTFYYSSTVFEVDYSNGASDTFSGYGFTYDYNYDYYYGDYIVSPNGGGVVTSYLAADPWDDELFSASGLGIPFHQILDAAATSSTADDFAVIATALAGDDTIWGSNYADRLEGFGGNDTIDGYDGDDTVYGDAGNDYLNGGTGADTMVGGLGNDAFIVDQAADKVIEWAGQGTDAVYASVSYALAAGQQIETIATTSQTGIGAINLYGNELGQSITGNNGANTISGGGGNDFITGLGGNDYLNGGTGADTMVGGLGNDAFIVDQAADKVIEWAGQGTDAVYASVSYALAAGQQIETIATTSQTGIGAINLYGNELGQSITGNNGANTISGGGGNDFITGLGGNDVIYGGAGKDTLTGGAGYDHFVFNTALNASTNVDRITDFNVVQDTIRLENLVMPGLGSQLGTLSSALFWKSTTGLAHDSNDRIIYETDTGWLNYDSNGSAAGGAVHIAQLNPNLALTNADFLVT